MTLTDIISKVTRYAKKIIVTDNSSSAAATIRQDGTGHALLVANKKDNAKWLVRAESDTVGNESGIYVDALNNMYFDSRDGTGNLTVSIKSDGSSYLNGGNVGIGTFSPQRILNVNGIIRLEGLPTYANNAAAIAGGLVADDVYKTNVAGDGHLRIVI
jgi:hypothetical protein